MSSSNEGMRLKKVKQKLITLSKKRDHSECFINLFLILKLSVLSCL